MLSTRIIVLALSIMSISSISIGRVSNARLLPGSQNQTAWLFNQADSSHCLCDALKRYPLSQITAVNSFPINSTCQLILSPPVLSPSIVYDIKCSLLLLQPLTNAPCCSNLAWLLERLEYSRRPSSSNINMPTALSINPANTFLSTMIYQGPFVRFHRSNLSLEGTYPLPTGYICATAVYRQGHIFFGCDVPAALVIFDETNLTSPLLQVNMSRYVRGVSFARNNSLLFVAVQAGNWSVYIYNIHWTPGISTSLVRTLTSATIQPWTMNTVNDSFVLMTSWEAGIPVYAVNSYSSTSNVWSISPLNATKVRSSEGLGQTVVDSCGRIWSIVYGFGIRIYDKSATVLLGNWTLLSGLSHMLLLDTYELFVTDFNQNLIHHFDPHLQCTS